MRVRRSIIWFAVAGVGLFLLVLLSLPSGPHRQPIPPKVAVQGLSRPEAEYLYGHTRHVLRYMYWDAVHHLRLKEAWFRFQDARYSDIQSLTKKPMFILVTAYEKFALEGFNLDVVDYLVKPVPFDRFLKACNKAYELFNLQNKPAAEKPADYFFVNVDYSLLKVVFNDVLWIEGLKDYVKIHLKSTTKPVVTRISMKTLEEQLPGFQFIRVHKSYIVSKEAITSIKKNSLLVGSMELPVSDNYKNNLTTLIGKG